MEQPAQPKDLEQSLNQLAQSVEKLSLAITDHLLSTDREIAQVWNYILQRKEMPK